MKFAHVVESVAFPGLLLGALLAAWSLHLHGWSDVPIVFLVVSVAATTMLVLQRLYPAVPEWRHWGPDAGTDMAHLVFNGVVTSIFGSAALAAGLYAGIVLAGDALDAALWPTRLPLVPQLVLALLVSEFFSYWLHRFSHSWSPLWRLHAMHHSSERLYLLSSSRSHPIHVVVTYVLQILPVALLGAPPETLLLLSVFTPVHGFMQHANIKLRTSPFNRVFATCDLHRWHHSTEPEEEHTNFGNNLILWDYVFGTYLRPADRFAPERVGLRDLPHFPQTFLRQLVSPFQRAPFRSEGDPS